MSKWPVRYTKMARDELDAIFHYISDELQAPENSVGQVRRIMSAIADLDEMPFRNPVYDKEPWKKSWPEKIAGG